MMGSKQYGGKLTKGLIAQYEQSPNWREGCFQNLSSTSVDIALYKIPGIIYKQLSGRERRSPDKPLPILPLDHEGFMSSESQPKFVWYGHSVVLMRLGCMTVLIDPMFGPDSSPIAPMPTKRFSENTLDLIDALPEIDLMLITHDHYDHLDYKSIKKLKTTTKIYFVALGVKRHLVSWGIDPDLIYEFDWWDEREIANINVTFTPTRHFSGRGLKDRAKSLWGGWALQSASHNIWFSGDGGYGPHFNAIGKRLGPFDFAFMECGQYDKNWQEIHMFPEESVLAAREAAAHKAMPVHWGGFLLAPHDWRDPAQRFAIAARDNGLDTIYPRLGQLFSPDSAEQDHWWES